MIKVDKQSQHDYERRQIRLTRVARLTAPLVMGPGQPGWPDRGCPQQPFLSIMIRIKRLLALVGLLRLLQCWRRHAMSRFCSSYVSAAPEVE